jgi:Holliday junction DNA helicase RuvA
MFYYIEGTVTVIEQGFVVLDVGGVGYLCNTSLNTISHLEMGKKAKLYTYCNIKEDAFDIYGFYDTMEKRCFELLLSVSGVGPKAAISILSSNSPADLAMAIIGENEKALTSAPGIGKRTAQRIILELKDKIAKENIPSTQTISPGFASVSVGAGKKTSDATAALAVLGYAPNEITAALRGVDTESMTVEEIIRYVLKNSMK